MPYPQQCTHFSSRLSTFMWGVHNIVRNLSFSHVKADISTESWQSNEDCRRCSRNVNLRRLLVEIANFYYTMQSYFVVFQGFVHSILTSDIIHPFREKKSTQASGEKDHGSIHKLNLHLARLSCCLISGLLTLFYCIFRMLVRASCQMYLQNFPMDVQKCSLNLESCKSVIKVTSLFRTRILLQCEEATFSSIELYLHQGLTFKA